MKNGANSVTYVPLPQYATTPQVQSVQVAYAAPGTFYDPMTGQPYVATAGYPVQTQLTQF